MVCMCITISYVYGYQATNMMAVMQVGEGEQDNSLDDTAELHVFFPSCLVTTPMGVWAR